MVAGWRYATRANQGHDEVTVKCLAAALAGGKIRRSTSAMSRPFILSILSIHLTTQISGCAPVIRPFEISGPDIKEKSLHFRQSSRRLCPRA